MKPRGRRVWKAIGLALLTLSVAATALAAWWVRRSWPQTRGAITVPGLRAPVQVLRDRWGVPQIYATNEHDLLFAQGFVHAQDRLWQMDWDRRLSSGRLAALLGPALLPADRLVRTIGIRRAAERDWALLSPETRGWLAAYAEGVNAFLTARRGRLPLEFTLLGARPEPWTPLDTLAWGKMMAFSLGQNHGMEMMRSRLASRLGWVAASRLLPPYEGQLILPPGAVAPPQRQPLLEATAAAGADGSASLSGAGSLGELARLLSPPAAALGSNAWVVHGSRTASGRPLLANDTHLELDMPSVWYENGLHAGRFDVAGFSFPGVPLVLIGHNRHIAWGISNMCGDVQDLYLERRDARGRLEAGDGWYEPQVVEERISVRGRRPELLRVVIGRHGPLVNAVEELPAMPPTALRWTALDGTRLLDALAGVDLAADWPAFRRALALWGAPALNFVYADDAGHIGYQAAARIPVRGAGHLGLAPVPGWDERYAWRGDVPWEAMPHVLDPASGFIVTANNKVVAEDYPYHIGFDYADPYRAQRLTQLLAGAQWLSVADARRIQAETYSLPAAALRPYLLALRPGGERERRALAQVRAWDLRFEPESAGATIYYVWYRQLLRNMVGDVVGPEFLARYPGFPVFQTPLYVRFLAASRRPWLGGSRPAPRESRDELVQRSFQQAVAALAARLGAEPSGWRWGRVHTALLVHQPLGASGIALLERLFNGRPVPLAGEALTVEANSPSPVRPYRVGLGVSQRLIVDLADLGSALAVNSTGQSGELFHPHREDQVELWGRNQYRLQPFSRQAVAAATRERLTLAPR
jgi:penicillin amidase